MTHSSDIAGLSEKLRRLGPDNSGFRKIGIEAATALVSLTVRVKELEVQNLALRALVKDGDDVEDERDRAQSERDSILKTKRSTTQRAQDFYTQLKAAESRALRAEQQRDEAYERAARVAEMGMLSFTDLLENEKVCASRNALETATICAKVAREIADAICRIASDPEGGEKPQEPTS